jgi:hypothetical protein
MLAVMRHVTKTAAMATNQNETFKPISFSSPQQYR